MISSSSIKRVKTLNPVKDKSSINVLINVCCKIHLFHTGRIKNKC